MDKHKQTLRVVAVAKSGEHQCINVLLRAEHITDEVLAKKLKLEVAFEWSIGDAKSAVVFGKTEGRQCFRNVYAFPRECPAIYGKCIIAVKTKEDMYVSVDTDMWGKQTRAYEEIRDELQREVAEELMEEEYEEEE